MIRKRMNLTKRLTNFYQRLSLRKKIFIIFDMLLLIISFLSFYLLQYTSRTYDQQLIDNSSHLLDLYSTAIENELQKIKSMSLANLSNQLVQSNLVKTDNSSTSIYEKAQSFKVMSNYLNEQAQSEIYLSSITIMAKNGENRTVGNSVIDITPAYSQPIQKKLKGKRGSLVWMGAEGTDGNIIAARNVRKLNSLQEIGTLIYRIDMDRLVDYVSTVSHPYRVKLAILSDNGEVIYRNKEIDQTALLKLKIPGSPNSIITMQNEKYLLSRETSSNTNWTYLYFLPYKQVFQNTVVVHSMSIVAFLLLLIVINIIGFSFSNSIAKPIQMLSRKMKSVQQGEFNISGISLIPEEKCDEVGQLNNDFILMIRKINNLIKENYLKQILAKESQLKALQAQINPHFLYNTLDSIYWMAKSEQKNQIAAMVRSLANLLRNSISTKEDIITLKQEISLLNDYILIQKSRFEDRLNFQLDVDPSLWNQLIPRLTLQPIVENSIKHGLEKMTSPCLIQVSAVKVENCFLIAVRDNGPGISPEEQMELASSSTKGGEKGGIGLANIRERIHLYYGGDYGIKITSTPGKGTCVTIKLPCQTI